MLAKTRSQTLKLQGAQLVDLVTSNEETTCSNNKRKRSSQDESIATCRSPRITNDCESRKHLDKRRKENVKRRSFNRAAASFQDETSTRCESSHATSQSHDSSSPLDNGHSSADEVASASLSSLPSSATESASKQPTELSADLLDSGKKPTTKKSLDSLQMNIYTGRWILFHDFSSTLSKDFFCPWCNGDTLSPGKQNHSVIPANEARIFQKNWNTYSQSVKARIPNVSRIFAEQARTWYKISFQNEQKEALDLIRENKYLRPKAVREEMGEEENSSALWGLTGLFRAEEIAMAIKWCWFSKNAVKRKKVDKAAFIARFNHYGLVTVCALLCYGVGQPAGHSRHLQPCHEELMTLWKHIPETEQADILKTLRESLRKL